MSGMLVFKPIFEDFTRGHCKTELWRGFQMREWSKSNNNPDIFQLFTVFVVALRLSSQQYCLPDNS